MTALGVSDQSVNRKSRKWLLRQFMVHHRLPQKQELSPDFKALDTAAREIATLLLRRKSPTSEQWQTLRDAIRAHPNYGSKVDELTTFGGIPRN